MDSPVTMTDPKDVLDLEALDDDVQHWVDLMPEHFEEVSTSALVCATCCTCNVDSGPNACGC